MKKNAFTIVELLIVVVILGILSVVTIVGYGSWQRRIAVSSVQSDVNLAKSALKSYNNFKNSYPPNLAGTNFAPSENVAMTLYTDAPSIGQYSGLTDDQNAQLFLNVCNANLSGTNNTSCVFNGKNNGAKIHVKGTSGSNTIWSTDVDQSEVVLSCGTACDTATAAMISQFTAQGGYFPIKLSGNTATLPEPTLVPNGTATRYCLQAISAVSTSISYHVSSSDTSLSPGACPSDPGLQYYP